MTALYIASDHGGYTLKTQLINSAQFDLIDLGCHSTDSVDYPDIADQMAQAILSTPGSNGILICGTGIGISIRANRYPGIRAALIYSSFTAEMCKAHNDANVVCLGGRTTSESDAILYIKKWMTTTFEGGRHQNRLDKIDRIKS